MPQILGYNCCSSVICVKHRIQHQHQIVRCCCCRSFDCGRYQYRFQIFAKNYCRILVTVVEHSNNSSFRFSSIDFSLLDTLTGTLASCSDFSLVVGAAIKSASVKTSGFYGLIPNFQGIWVALRFNLRLTNLCLIVGSYDSAWMVIHPFLQLLIVVGT